jgi:glucose-1-phosphate adenylyltransferase
MKRTMAVILAGGEGERLSILSQERAKPAVPFGGKYRIIDFTLSNCINSDIDDVVVLTQYNPRSLNDHIGLGRPWDLDRNTGGVKLLQPYIARGRVAEWYRGTADAVLRNMNVLEHDPSDTVVVLAGDHIYKMDYQPFVAAHRRHRADVTIAVRRVPLAEASRMGILAMDENDRVIEWQEKPKQPKSDLASMGVYVFSMPSMLGINRSIRTTSGSRRRAIATPSDPSAASPTTSMSSWRSRKTRRPVRTTEWSSTMRTRIGVVSDTGPPGTGTRAG